MADKDIYGFKNVDRTEFKHRDINKRLGDYKKIYLDYTEDFIKLQASRCMDCGIPFCHGFGCPLDNQIPDFNDLVYRGLWYEALMLLQSTNNFPEITGKICPALCEEACTLNVGLEPVTIKNIELAIIEKGFENGWIQPVVPRIRTGKSIAVIGSGPAGLVASQNLNRSGHNVIVFEKDAKPGGFLRYGIPDFKLEKYFIDRRIKQMQQEGIEFRTGINAGIDIKANELMKQFDVILLANGARESRDLPVEGRNLNGIYFAVDYLGQANMRVDGMNIPKEKIIDAKNKNVIVIGGGDTGADCIGTARRQGAKDIYQVEILPEPLTERSVDTPWPMYAKKLRTSSSHNEGCERMWGILTQKFIGKTMLEKVLCTKVEWYSEKGEWKFKEIKNTAFELKADMALLAMGFTHPVHDELIKDKFGYGKTSVEKVFAAGDSARGASLVVWAFSHARDVSVAINEYLNNF